MVRNKKLLMVIDTLVVVCSMAISYMVLRYIRREFDGAERAFAYLILFSTSMVLLPGLHRLIHGKRRAERDDDQDSFKE